MRCPRHWALPEQHKRHHIHDPSNLEVGTARDRRQPLLKAYDDAGQVRTVAREPDPYHDRMLGRFRGPW
jgi:hypothetical protein